MKIQKPVYYGEYLQLDKILQAQAPESTKYGPEAHDETLFIIIHQTYELWFKQILHELGSIRDIMQTQPLPNLAMSTIESRLNRVIKIQKILVDQLPIIETMTSLDFMDFRDYLVPASGFQSLQFRLVEATLGIKNEHRMEAEKLFFNSRLKPEDRKTLDEAEKKESLFELIQNWLERMPFHIFNDFDFWAEYSKSVDKMLKADHEIISTNPVLDEKTRALEIKNLEMTRMSFNSILDSNLFDKLKANGKIRLSQKATLSAVFIFLYRDYPALQAPFRILNSLIEIDEQFTTWRYRHSIMAHRLLGTKIGTGGSSGHEYLKATTERNRVFLDYFNLATFLLPKSMIPKLPKFLEEELSLVYERN